MPAEQMPAWVRWITAYNRAWFVSVLERVKAIEEQTARPQPRVLRSAAEAARYCGFNKTEAFVAWARRVGFEIPKTKLVKQHRPAFLVADLDAALLRDPALCRNRRNT